MDAVLDLEMMYCSCSPKSLFSTESQIPDPVIDRGFDTAGRELEQAAAAALANVGGLQQLSDTPEPAYLHKIFAPSDGLDFQPPLTGKEDASTPEFGAPAIQSTTTSCKMDREQNGATNGSFLDSGEGLTGSENIEQNLQPEQNDIDVSDGIGNSEGLPKTSRSEVLRTTHKSRLPWR